jgi:hypothetical protein
MKHWRPKRTKGFAQRVNERDLSEPGADGGSRAGSLRGVVDATGHRVSKRR